MRGIYIFVVVIRQQYGIGMEVRNVLVELGMSEQEAKVYMSLLKTGSSLASHVAFDTRINRSSVYQILSKLIDHGYVSYVIRENRRYYDAVHPEKLVYILKEKEEKLKGVLSKLMNLRKPISDKPLVEILEGKAGIKTIVKDILKINENWFAFGTGRATEIMPYYVSHWQKQRQKQKIKANIIFDDSFYGRKRGSEFRRMKFTEIKYMPEKYMNPASIWLYGNRVTIIMWSKDHPFGIRITNKEVAETYKNYFKMLWGLAKK